MAATFALASAVLVVVIGDFHGAEAGRVQPAKLAAMEALWDTREGVPFYLILIPDTKNERNSVEAFGIPKIVSFLAYRDWDAELKGLKEFPEKDRPPVMPVFVSFRVMVGLGFLFIGLAFVAWYLARKDRLESSPLFLRIMLYAVPLPYIAAQLGWIVAEMGRQPWIVYGVLRTSEGVSRSIEPSQVMASLVGFGFFYSFLGILDIYLLARFAGKGPDDTGVAY
jgi:cytochrome d ubiquinol oxidase subunit I